MMSNHQVRLSALHNFRIIAALKTISLGNFYNTYSHVDGPKVTVERGERSARTTPNMSAARSSRSPASPTTRVGRSRMCWPPAWGLPYSHLDRLPLVL